MGTIHIKNLSTLKDKAAARIAVDFWLGSISSKELNECGIKVIKKGHTLTVVDLGEPVKIKEE